MLRPTRLISAFVTCFLLASCGGTPIESPNQSSSISITSSSSSSLRSSISSFSSSSAAHISSSSSHSSSVVSASLSKVVAVAINAGGPDFKSHDGTRYLADTYFSGGITYGVAEGIALTEDDALYQTERWAAGTLSYDIPLPNGKYDVVLKFAEIYHLAANSRVFDATIEGVKVISGLDIVSAAGAKTALDRQFNEVNIVDKKLNITLQGTKDNAKISAIVVYREANGGDIYKQQCLGCHGNEKGENAVSGGALTASECGVCGSQDNLASFIDIAMPAGKPGLCKGQCSVDVAKYILNNFAGYSGNAQENIAEEDVPIGGSIAACEQGVDAAFGGLRRLTRVEYQNMVTQLFNEASFTSTNLGTDDKLGNFSINVELPISTLQSDRYMEVGESVAKNAAANMDKWSPCAKSIDPPLPPTGYTLCAKEKEVCLFPGTRLVAYGAQGKYKFITATNEVECTNAIFGDPINAVSKSCYYVSGATTQQDEACVGQIIDKVASRAYRRPVSSNERERLLGVYRKANGGFREGVETLLHAVLTSPNFLYHLEFGQGQNLPNGVVPLSSYEIAARLSFFLWRSAPDNALLEAAKANQLQTPQQIEVQARRMLQDSRARNAVGQFHMEWLKLTYPEPGSAGELEAIAAIEDTVRTVTELTYTDNGDFKDLFSVSYGYLNGLTKDLYGVTSSPIASGSNGFDKYALNSAERGGILTRAGFLSFNTPPSGRGKFLREQLLCGEIPDPPADFIPELGEGNPNDPPRMRWLEHVSNPACGGCHRLMDPLGFGFEHFDTKGKWRSMIGTWPVDATGQIVETSDIDGYFDGHAEFQQILSKSSDTRACYAIQWFRFAIGREPGNKDSCSLAEINQLAAANDYNIRDVMVAITQSNAFRYRRAEPAQ